MKGDLNISIRFKNGVVMELTYPIVEGDTGEGVVSQLEVYQRMKDKNKTILVDCKEKDTERGRFKHSNRIIKGTEVVDLKYEIQGTDVEYIKKLRDDIDKIANLETSTKK